MKYILTDTQRYDTSTLQDELNVAGVVASINGHGEKSFTVRTNDEAGADTVVQAHIIKGDAQHDTDISNLEDTNHIKAGLEGTNKSIAKAVALTIFDEINLLRVDAGLSPRTLQQFKDAVKSKL